MKSGLLWSLVGLLFAAVCAVALYRAWPILFPDLAAYVPADPACDLRAGACVSRVGKTARVSFSIDPKSIPLVKPLQLQVHIQGLAASGVEVDFSGVDMEMGFNRVRLEPMGEGGYGAKGMLPVCVRDAMEWEARVLITTDQGLTAVAYRFMTAREGHPLPGAQD